MTSDRKKPGVVFWATVVLVVVLVGYVGAYAYLVEPIYFHTSVGRLPGDPPGSMDPAYGSRIFRGYSCQQFWETVFSPIHWIDRKVRRETWTVHCVSMNLTDYIEMSPSPTMLQSSASGSASLALSIFGIAFAAFCVWLTVRIVNRRARWAKWTLAVTLSLPVLYVASFGSWCWATSHWGPVQLSGSIYHPIGIAWFDHVGDGIGDSIDWYANVFAEPTRKLYPSNVLIHGNSH